VTSGKKKKMKVQRPRGFEDISGKDYLTITQLTESIERVYQGYGFEPLETSVIEYSEMIGSFLPDQDRPNEGVFSFEDDDGNWLSLRYDLTAGLARYVSENFDSLPKPYRRYQSGFVFRNEKSGPGRFRQFLQIDADTVGSENPLSDAEMCMMFCDSLENVGIKRGEYLIRLNSRNLLDALLEQNKIQTEDNTEKTYLSVMRSVDKLDRLGLAAVELLLGKGRKDESGDYTEGAGLDKNQISSILSFLENGNDTKKLNRLKALENLEMKFGGSQKFSDAVSELNAISGIIENSGYQEDQIAIDPSVVRGLSYYTGAIYEADLIFSNNKKLYNYGSVGGGGRYDNLIERLKGVSVPSSGISIGVSRLANALALLNEDNLKDNCLDVVVLVMDKEKRSIFYEIASQLRKEKIIAECYTGDGGMKAQLRYADKRNAKFVVIVGEDEIASDTVTIKDLARGKELSENINDNEEWRSGKGSQISISKDQLIAEIRRKIKKSS